MRTYSKKEINEIMTNVINKKLNKHISTDIIESKTYSSIIKNRLEILLNSLFENKNKIDVFVREQSKKRLAIRIHYKCIENNSQFIYDKVFNTRYTSNKPHVFLAR